MRHHYLDLIGASLSLIGFVTIINSELFTFIGSISSILPPLILALSVIGLMAIPLLMKPFKSVPTQLYAFTLFIISLAYSHMWLATIVKTSSYGIIPMFRLLLTPDLIFIIIAFISIIFVLAVRGLRSPINIMFSTGFLKFFLLSLIISLPIIYFQGMLGIGLQFPKMGLIQGITLFIIFIMLMIIGSYFILGLIVRRAGGGYRKKRRFIHISESYPSVRLDDTTFYKASDLHFRVYRLYRIHGGELSQQAIEELLRILRKMVIYYALDGYVYIYLIAEAYRLGKALENLDFAEHILTRSMDVDVIKYEYDYDDKMLVTRDATMPRDIPEQIDRDRLRFLVSDEALGTVLVYEYEGSASEGRFAPRKMYIKSGLYTLLTESGRLKHITELSAGYRISSAQAMVYGWDFMKLSSPVRMSERHTPLYLRKGRIHIDGSKQLVSNVWIKPETVCIEIPLRHHIFFLGKSRSGKSVGIANVIKYINGLGGRKVIVFDWVGNFTSLANTLKNSIVLYPGEDVFIDLYKVFNKRELVDVYEEASILFFKDVERASFSPIVYDMLARTIEESDSHSELIEKVRNIKEMATYRDERDASAAILRRLSPLNPELYTPIEGIEGDLLKLLDKHDVLIIDLASLPTEGDQILFTLACLRVLMRSWNSSLPELYVVIDEAHRLAPKIRGMREWVLSRVAREGGKYNIYLILADQTLTTVSPDVWNNMGHVFIYHLDNPDDLRMVHPLFSAWEKRYKITGRTLEEFVDSRLRLNPGECYLIRFGGESEPIPAYFQHLKIVETGEYRRIDENKFRRVLDELNISRIWSSDIEVRKAIIEARKLIRRYDLDYITSRISEYMENLDDYLNRGIWKLEVDGILLAKVPYVKRKEIKPSLPLRIFLSYHDSLKFTQLVGSGIGRW